MGQMSPLRRRMIEDMTVRNLSPATQRSHVHAVAKFGRYFGRSPDRLGVEDVRAFQVHLVSTGISWPPLRRCWAQQPVEHGALHAGLDRPDPADGEPARPPEAGGGAARLTRRRHVAGAGSGGRLPPPRRCLAGNPCWASWAGRAPGDERDRAVPDGGAGRPQRMLHILRAGPHRLQFLPQPALPDV